MMKEGIIEQFEKVRKRVIEKSKHLTIFHWMRLGICFGLYFWMDQMIRIIIAGRSIERILTMYQLGVIERELDITFDPVITKVYVDSFLFESLLIIIICLCLWLFVVFRFGLPKKVFKRQ